MKNRQSVKRQGSQVFVALLLFGLVLLVLQLWLFVAVLEGLLGGHTGMNWPAAGISVLILLVQIWMFRGVVRLDRTH